MLYYVHSSPIYNCQKLERTQVSLNRRVDAKKMWYIYTMEYYSAIRNNEFMKFLGKWMEPKQFLTIKEQLGGINISDFNFTIVL